MKILKDTDAGWEKLGQSEPYWAVLTHEHYRLNKLAESARSSFFESGDRHVGLVFDVIHRHFDAEFSPRNTLDFGCGVGRLVIPFARRGGSVTGVDISPSMLEEAARNAADAGVRATFTLGDDRLSRVTGTFDLVHTVIVLQHIAPARGERILRRLIDLVAPDGIAAIHLTYLTPSRRPKRLLHWGRARLPGVAAVANLIRGQPLGTPHIPMYEYDLARVFQLIGEVTTEMHVLPTDHAGNLGVLVFFRRAARRPT
ncbi:MAG: class I SAM-dependent methyltransferase [Gemmatimonadota bacterium]|nr:class I SAM-dependent methyltransferase [Gemmatimonadota bacterium]